MADRVAAHPRGRARALPDGPARHVLRALAVGLRQPHLGRQAHLAAPLGPRRFLHLEGHARPRRRQRVARPATKIRSARNRNRASGSARPMISGISASRHGWGGPWWKSPVKADEPSDPYLMTGFEHKCLHLFHEEKTAVKFDVELDALGDGSFKRYITFNINPGKAVQYVFPTGLSAHWMRVSCRSRCARDGATALYLSAGDFDRITEFSELTEFSKGWPSWDDPDYLLYGSPQATGSSLKKFIRSPSSRSRQRISSTTTNFIFGS